MNQDLMKVIRNIHSNGFSKLNYDLDDKLCRVIYANFDSLVHSKLLENITLFQKYDELISGFLKKNTINYLTILSKTKVWRYDCSNSSLLAPLHYVRSFMTVVIHTVNPSQEQFVFGDPGENNPIDSCDLEQIKKHGYRPNESVFSIIFPGLHANQTFPKLYATQHAVLNYRSLESEQSRYSLIFLILPKEGFEVSDKYISNGE